MPLVAFVTAYDEYAVRAFELNAVDYLLKPVTGRDCARLSTARRSGWSGRPADGSLGARGRRRRVL